jgi:hypothetical protein
MTHNTTVGGRFFAGVLFCGAVLSGGTLGFALVSLSWLARGDGVVAIFDARDELKDSLPNSFNSTADLYDAIVEAADSIESVDSQRAGAQFWILLLVLYGIFTVPFAWVRGTTKNPLKISMSVIGTTFVVLLTSLGMLVTVVGQHGLWTHIFGSMLKSLLVGMLGMFLSGVLVYVSSSHDCLRESVGRALRDCGRTLSHVAACSCAVIEDGCDTAEFDNWMRDQSVKNYIHLLGELGTASTYVPSCKTEPTLPGLASQVGADVNEYNELIKAAEDVVSQIGVFEIIFASVSEEKINSGGKLQFDETSKLMAHLTKIVVSEVAAVLAVASDGLMDLNNAPQWRPHTMEFWISLHKRLLSDNLEDPAVRERLCYSGFAGVRDVLQGQSHFSHSFSPRGSSLVLLSAIESLMEYTIHLERVMASALGLVDGLDYVAFEQDDLLTALRDGDKRKECTPPGSEVAAQSRKMATKKKATAIGKSIGLLLAIGTGLYGLYTYFEGLVDMVRTRGKPYSRQQIVFAIKYWTSLMILMIVVVLSTWLGFANKTDSNLDNQKQMANYLLTWSPMYATICASICMNFTVELSIVKIVVRSAMVALGGVLGYLVMLNGTLAQNFWWVFFMALLVQGVFCTLSPDSTTRYSVFLILYTYFSVSICQYTGECCKSGDVLEFVGKTVSTIVGGAFSLLFTSLVAPTYASEVILAKESGLLDSDMKMLASELSEEGRHAGKERAVEALHDRLSIARGIVSEKVKSLDRWRWWIFDITILPLPKVCKGAFLTIGRMGMQLNVCMRALRSSLFGNNPSTESPLRSDLKKLSGDIEQLFDATEKVHVLVAQNLVQRDNAENEIHIAAALKLAEGLSADLLVAFDKAIAHHDPAKTSRADLNVLTWLQYLLAVMRGVCSLAKELVENDDYRIRDSRMDFCGECLWIFD